MNKHNQLILKGIIEDAANQKLVLQELTPESVLPLDSVMLKEKGKFSFLLESKKNAILLLKIQDQLITIFPDSNGTIEINSKLPEFLLNANISGSVETVDFLIMQKRLRTSSQFVDSLGKVWEKQKYLPHNLKIKEELDKSFENEWSKQRTLQMDYIHTHAKCLSGMLGLYQTIGNLPLFKIDVETDLFKSIGDSLEKTIPGNPHVVKFKSILSRFEKLERLQELEQNNSENAHNP